MGLERNADDVKEFISEATAYLEASEPMLAALQASGDIPPEEASAQVAAVFRAFHSIKGVAGFLSFANVQEVTHRAEEILDRVRSGKRRFDRALGEALLSACDLLRKYFDVIAASGEDAGPAEEKSALLERLRAFSEPAAGASAATRDPSGAGAPGGEGWVFPALRDAETIGKLMAAVAEEVDALEAGLIAFLDAPTKASILEEGSVRADRIRMHAAAFGFSHGVPLAGALAESLSKAAGRGGLDAALLSPVFGACNALKPLFAGRHPSTAEKEKASEALRQLAAAEAPAASQASWSPAPAAASPASAGSAGSALRGDIRVSLDKLDRMVDLIEELGVVSTGVLHALDGAGRVDEHRQSANGLRKVTEELQEITVSIRMVPLSTVFRKMIRLVGDVSAKLGKQARLEIVGEETELDRDAVEALQDPLVHILRNCLDHGLEAPEARAASGKPPAGAVRLQAWHSGGEAWISVSDDGRGIDREKVLAKAVAQGLVPAGAALSEAEILDFIFHPGFSLAKEVTEFSGRGVGMDVVRRNIQGLKGRVEVETRAGEGTTFLIRIPMANALTESMLVRVGDVRYTLRVASIRETFRPTAKAVTRLPDGREMVGLRGRLYPLVRIHRLRGVSGAETEIEKGLIVLVENRGRQSALLVDEVLGKIQAVIKPPPSLLKSASTLAGFSIIGTGSDAVALALDINALDNEALEARPGSAPPAQASPAPARAAGR